MVFYLHTKCIHMQCIILENFMDGRWLSKTSCILNRCMLSVYYRDKHLKITKDEMMSKRFTHRTKISGIGPDMWMVGRVSYLFNMLIELDVQCRPNFRAGRIFEWYLGIITNAAASTTNVLIEWVDFPNASIVFRMNGLNGECVAPFISNGPGHKSNFVQSSLTTCGQYQQRASCTRPDVCTTLHI